MPFPYLLCLTSLCFLSFSPHTLPPPLSTTPAPPQLSLCLSRDHDLATAASSLFRLTVDEGRGREEYDFGGAMCLDCVAVGPLAPALAAARHEFLLEAAKVGEDEDVPFSFAHDPAPPAASPDDVVFVVSTAPRFHSSRARFVRQTWGRDARHLRLYSHAHDAALDARDVGVGEVGAGFCAKTRRMLQAALDEFPRVQWVVKADDDTILSVPRLLRLLGHYRAAEKVVLGDRYAMQFDKFGYTYISGGGGIVFSRAALDALIGSDPAPCSPTAPDDLYLGQAGDFAVHEPGFHQAPLSHYPAVLLAARPVISAHKLNEDEPYAAFLRHFETSASPASARAVHPYPVPKHPAPVPGLRGGAGVVEFVARGDAWQVEVEALLPVVGAGAGAARRAGGTVGETDELEVVEGDEFESLGE
jgi:hypothetical protein